MSLDENRPIPPGQPLSEGTSSGPSAGDQSILSYEVAQQTRTDGAVPHPDPFGLPSRFVPEDLRVPWGWIDLLLLAGVWVGIVALSLLFAVVIQSLGVRLSATGRTFFVIFDQIVISFAILAHLFVHVRSRFRVPFWRTVGWRPLRLEAASLPVVSLGLVSSGFLLSILIQLASGVVGTKAKLPIEAFFQDRRTALFLMLLSILLAPWFEETIFRGYIYPVVARSFGVTVGILATGTLFGLLHAMQLWGGWGQIGLLIVVGIVFTCARAFTKTVVASYLLHLSYNSFLFIAFLTASHGMRSLPR